MRPIVLTFVRYYLPGFRAGGPIRTIANMVEELGDEVEFRIVALDRDMGDASPYSGVKYGEWTPLGKAYIRHVLPSTFGMSEVSKIARSTPHDVVYLNSLFCPRFTQQVLINRRLGQLPSRPVILAPRGEFSEGALQLKRLKKQAFMRFARLFGLYDDLIWQASSEFEAADIHRAFPVGPQSSVGGRIVVTGHVSIASDLISGDYGTAEVEERPRGSSAGGPLRVCFLSRVSPKKNLDYALRVLAQVRAPVHFSIFGPAEDAAYWAHCQALIAALPPHIAVTYEGAVEHTEVVATLARQDLFLFPTRGENFGHVIHEALRACLPILISDQTPWRQLEEQGVGWDLPLADLDSFARRIDEVAGWSAQEFGLARACARALARRIADDPAIIEANRRLFLDAIQNSACESARAATVQGDKHV